MKLLRTISLAVAALSALAMPTRLLGFEDSPTGPWEGEISATGVYIRSGPGINYYPTSKLNAGDHVLVLGEKFGWYQIAPPAGSFSFVDMANVTKNAGGKSGTIKGDKVYIRAGSSMEAKKTSTQVVLSKGATVDIIGEQDGFFKIKPPPGAMLYISKQYIKPVESSMRTGMVERHVSSAPKTAQPAHEAAQPATANTPPTQNPAGQNPAVQNPAPTPANSDLPKIPEPKNGAPTSDDPTGAGNSNPPADNGVQPINPPPDIQTPAGEEQPMTPTEEKPKPAAKKKNAKGSVASNSKKKKDLAVTEAPPAQGRYRAMLDMAESELKMTLGRPVKDQNFDNLIKRYAEIASQSDEYVPSEVAKIRIRKLKDLAEFRAQQRALVASSDEIDVYHAEMGKKRDKILAGKYRVELEHFELEGILKRSAAFAPELRRYRLADPTTDSTIAYVDIPTTLDTNPEHLIGRLVGINVSGQRFSPSARVPIAVARRLIDLSIRVKSPEELAPSEVEEPAREPVKVPATPTDNDAGATKEKAGSNEPAASAGEKSEPK